MRRDFVSWLFCVVFICLSATSLLPFLSIHLVRFAGLNFPYFYFSPLKRNSKICVSLLFKWGVLSCVIFFGTVTGILLLTLLILNLPYLHFGLRQCSDFSPVKKLRATSLNYFLTNSEIVYFSSLIRHHLFSLLLLIEALWQTHHYLYIVLKKTKTTKNQKHKTKKN